MRFACLRSVVAVVVLGAAAAPAAADMYTFTPIDPPGSLATFPGGINNAGDVTLFSLFQNGSNLFFESLLLSGGVYTPLNVPGAMPNSTQLASINNLGQYVGSYNDASGAMHGFTFVNGTYNTIDAPGAVNGTTVESLNSQGVAVVAGLDDLDNFDSFILSGGNFTPLVFPGATAADTFGAYVNDAGDIVGSYADAAGAGHGFLLHNGQFTTIDDPLADDQVVGTNVFGMNNLGDIVGTYSDASGDFHGFVDDNGVFTTVDNPLAVGNTTLFGINDSGELLGYYAAKLGTDPVAFLATPAAVAAPEPAALALLAAAGLTLAARRLRQRA